MAGDNYDELMDDYSFNEEFENEKDKNITRGELEKILGLPGNGEIEENQYLDFSNKGLGPKAAQEIADHLKFDTEGITIDLSNNHIMDDGAYEFHDKNLGKGVTLNLSGNDIFGDFAAGLIFEISFSENSTLNLSNNEIDDMDLEDYYNEMINNYYKRDGNYYTVLRKGAQLNLSNNNIGDTGAKILVDIIELEDGAILDLSNNRISEEMKKTLKEKEKSYNDKGVKCKIIV